MVSNWNTLSNGQFTLEKGFETESGLSQMNPCLDHTYRGVDEKNALPYLVTQVTIQICYQEVLYFVFKIFILPNGVESH